jgi:hypothetical protein
LFFLKANKPLVQAKNLAAGTIAERKEKLYTASAP